MTILFLCSGNTCRSPMAMAAWRSLERSDEKSFGDRVRVRSAGLAALSMENSNAVVRSAIDRSEKGRKLRGVPASRYAQEVARGWGEDLSSHRARGLSSALLAEADFVLTMTDDQAHAVRVYCGLKSSQVRALGDFSDEIFSSDAECRLASLMEIETNSRTARDIIDPFGGSLEAYQSCGEAIRSALIGVRRALRTDGLSRLNETS